MTVRFPLNLRPATDGDAEFLATLRNELAGYFLGAEPATTSKTKELLGSSRTFIFERGRVKVGSFALYNFRRDGAEFGRFMIKPALWLNGFGHDAMALALDAARRLGIERLWLVAKENNTAALTVYGRAGFRPVAGRPRAGMVAMEMIL